MKVNSFAELVGNTPCVQFKSKSISKEARIWLKLEGFNPTGSLKDRACLSNINHAINNNELKAGKTILDASSGNMACSLAYFGAVFGYPVKVVCSSKLTKDKSNFIKYYGGELVNHGDFTLHGNQLCQEMMEKDDRHDYCFLDQLHNWNNPEGSYTTLGPEIYSEFPNLTALVASLGSGGTLYGAAKYLKEKGSDAIIIATEASLGTIIPGVGGFDDGDYMTPFIERGFKKSLFNKRIKINYSQALERSKELSKEGFFVGLQTGAVVHSAITAINKYNLKGDILVISGDAGWKNMSGTL
jgi:cysteine synthase